MILLWGPDLIQIYNEAYIGLIGAKHPMALGRSIRETQAESWEVIGPMIHEVMTTGVPNWVPAQMLPLDRAGYREESYFSLSYSAVDDDQGRIAGMLCVCSEVTQQVIGERRTQLLRDLALKAGETRSVDATCSEILTTIDLHPSDVPFAILYVRDPTTGEMTRCGQSGLDVPAGSSVPNGHDAAGDWSIDRAARGETAFIEAVDQRLAAAAGPWKDLVRSAVAIPIPSAVPGTPIGVLVAGVNPNRALDDGYRSFFDLLASQVSVALRNARSYEDERRRAEALAELDRAKTAFFSNVSHEFRTPLTLMLGPIAETLADKDLSSGNRERLLVAQRNAHRLLKLVNSLLDYSRVEAGRLQARFSPIDLGQFVTDIAGTFRSTIERAGVALVVECEPLGESIWIDQELFEKVLLNLLSNAFKFTWSGRISVRCRREDGEVVVSVQDTGIGIPEAELPRIFERFHRVEGHRGRSFEGTGIGLALVRELVALHGGTIGVTSRVDQGSDFRVSLPIGRAHIPDERIAADPQNTGASVEAFVEEAEHWSPRSDLAESPEPTPEPVGSPKPRLLIADDNADMRAYLSAMLSPAYEVELVADGQQLIDALRQRAPDLVITDVMMPGVDGFGVLAAVRRDPELRQVPVIMLSARAGEEAGVEALSAGADDYLVKPFSARELLARVASNLRLVRMRHRLDHSEDERRIQAQHAEALARAKAGLVRMNIELERFAYIASHDLREPLRTVTQFLSLLDKRIGPTLDAENSRFLAAASAGGSRMQDLLLDLVRYTDLLRATEPSTVVDLNPVVVEAVQRVRDAMGSGVAAAVEIAKLPSVYGMRSQLVELFVALVENAFKFHEGSPGRVRISGEIRGAESIVRIQDNGIGIAVEDHQRIFDIFQRLHRERYPGTGIGLSIARLIAERHGGRMAVESALGAGSTFIVHLRGPVQPGTPATGFP